MRLRRQSGSLHFTFSAFVGVVAACQLLIAPFAMARLTLAERPAYARSSDALVYHGKILRPDGMPVEGNVTLNVQIYSPEPSKCLLWAETQSVTAVKGGFSAEIGYVTSRRMGPNGGVAPSFREVFLNNPGLTLSSAQCAQGTSYTPTASDDRIMKVTFVDAGTTITMEEIPIKSVPFAKQAQEISGYGINNLMKISGAGSPNVVFSPTEVDGLKTISGSSLASQVPASAGSANQVLGMNAAGNGMEYKSITAGSNVSITHTAGGIEISATGGGGGGGSVTSVGVGGLPLSVVNGTSSPVISIAQAGSGQAGFLSAADWALFNSKQPAGSYLTGITSSDVTTALGFTPINQNLVSGQVLVGNASNVATGRLLRIGDIRSVSGAGTDPFFAAAGVCSAGQALSYNSVNDKIECAAYSLTASQISTAMGNDSVTFAQVQNIATNRLLGRSSGGSGDIEELSLGSGLSLSGGTLSASGSGGTVTNVSGTAPIAVTSGTSSPVISIAQASGSQNGFLSSADWTLFNSKLGAELDPKIGTNTTNMLSKWNGSALVASSVFENSGNIGIGTTSPSYPLEVNGTIAVGGSTGGRLQLVDGGTRGYIGWNGGNVIKVFQTSVNVQGGFNVESNNSFTADVDTLVVDPSSNSVGIGTLSPKTKLDVAGGVRIGTEGTACSAGLAGTLRYNSGNVEYCNGSSWAAFGVSGAGITALNGSTVSSHSFATPGTSGTAPAWSTVAGTGVHTLNIPMAAATGVTAGLLSKTDYDAFTAKQAAGNYLTALTGDVVATGPGSVGATIQANAVTTGKIIDSAVTTAKLADAAVTSTKINDGAVGTSKVADDAITFAKLQNISTNNRILGRSTAGAGDTEEILLGSGLSLASGTLTATGTGGTVTSVGVSVPSFMSSSGGPITSSGTISLGLNSQSANTVFAAPDGTAGAPTFRTLTANDIPNLDAGKITTGTLSAARGGTGIAPVAGDANKVYGINAAGTGSEFKSIVQGSGVTVSHAAGTITISATGSGGTVTNVTGVAPLSVSSGTTTPQISISQANSTTSGFLSSTDWQTFNNKLGTATSFSGDVSGSFNSMSVQRVRGVNVSATSPSAAGQVFRYDGTANYVPAFLSLADIRSTVTPGNTMFPASTCTAAQTMTWSSLTDTMSCTNIAISSGAVSGLGALATKSSVDLSTGDATGTLATARLPAFTGGDVTSSAGSAALTLANSGVTAGTYRSVTVDAKGRVTSGTNPTTLAGYGITDAVMNGGNTGAVLLGTNDSNSLTFETNNIAAMTVNSAGNVGIGTTSPSSRLSLSEGDISVSRTTANTTAVNLSRAAGQFGFLNFQTTGSRRWHLGVDNATESGANAGSNFYINRASDAGAFVDTSLVIYRDSGNISLNPGTGNVGIGTTTPGQKLTVNGTIESLTGGVKFPDGTTQTTAFSQLSAVSFWAYGSAQSIPNASGTTIINPTVVVNIGNVYNSSTGTFTAPLTGSYICAAQANFEASGGTAAAPIDLLVGFVVTGGTAPTIASRIACSQPTCAVTSTQNIYLTSGGTIQARVYHNSGAARSLSGNERVNFSCTLMSPGAAGGESQWVTNGTSIHFPGTGNVGIGTTTPSAKLEVAGGLISNSVAIRNTDSWNIIGTELYSSTHHSAFRHTRYRGTAASPTPIQDGDLLGYFDAYGYNGTGTQWAGGMGVIARSNWGSTRLSDLNFSVAGAGEVMRIESSGNVGIGTSDPNSRLEVNGTIKAGTTTGYAALSPGNGSQSGYMAWFRPDGTTRMGYMGWDASDINLNLENGSDFVITNGRIGVGTSAPAVPLDIQTSALLAIPTYGWLNSTVPAGIQAGGGSVNTSIRTTGRVVSPEFNAISDLRKKTELRDISSDEALTFINKSRPVHYRWINGEKNENYGFIAQDLLKLGLNEVVSVTPDSEVEKTVDSDGFVSPKGYQFNVNYNQIIAILTKAIQELQAKWFSKQQAVEAEVKALQSEVDLLKQENKSKDDQLLQMRAYLCQKDPAAPFCGQ